jgi:hypothetical protein
MSRRLLAVLAMLGTTFVLAARAEDKLPVKVNPKGKGDVKRPADDTDPKVKIEDAATKQEVLKRQFDDFKQKLLGLAQRMENSSKPEDKEKAKILKQAIKKVGEEGVDTKFTTLVEGLKNNKAFKDTEQLTEILKMNQELRRNLREILDLLSKDDRDAELRKQIEEYKRLIEELKTVIRKQELVLNKTIVGRSPNQDLKKDQNKVRNQTHDLVNPKSNKGAEAKHGEGKGSKEGKNGIGEAKNDAKDPKADNKDGKGGEGKDGKNGEGKDGKGGEGKDAKPGEGKDGKGGEGKDGKGGEGKDGKGGEGKDGKPGEGKDGKGGEGKDGKPGEGKDGKGGEGKDGKPGEGKDGKPGAGKPGEGKDGKPGAGKPGAGKPGEGKPGAGKPGAGKPSDSKGKGEGKGDGKGKAGAGKPGSGKPGEGKPGQGKPGSGQPGQGQPGEGKPSSGGGGKSPPQPPQPTPEQTQIKKKIEDAEKYQEKAENKLEQNKREEAPEDEEAALQNLKDAQKKLEDLLRQLREEEIERLLAKLEARVRRMLAMQIAVRNGTVDLDKVIKANPKGEPTRADQQSSNVLSDNEDDIVKEATAGLRLLEAEGSAVAFAEVFQQVRGDMITVAGRLRKTDTGVVTVTIENQIIETLQEMADALKKAIADAKKSKGGKPGQSGPPPDPKLIDLLAELKMIRSMQKRVNARTELYGVQYKGEQAPSVETGATEAEREKYERIQTELKDLSKRQQKISKVTHDIATGKNEAK